MQLQKLLYVLSTIDFKSEVNITPNRWVILFPPLGTIRLVQGTMLTIEYGLVKRER